MSYKVMIWVLILGILGFLQGEKSKKSGGGSRFAKTEIRPTSSTPSLPKVNFHKIQQNLGDSIWGFDCGEPTAETQCLGVEFDGTYFWVSGGNSKNDPNKLYQFDSNGNLIATFDQPTSVTGWGMRDLVWDGQYIYGSGTSVLHEWDPVSYTWTGNTIQGPENPNRGLAYDPATDHFFTANWDSPIYEFDRSGNIVATYPNSYSIYGLAWDDVSEGGPYLWVAAQEPLGPTLYNVIYQFDPASETYTGVSFSFAIGDTTYAGGLCFTTEWDPSKGILFELLQTTPNDVVIGFFATEVSKDYLILDLDPTPLTGPWLSTLFSTMELTGDYTTDTTYFDSLSNYLSLWLLVGVSNNNTLIDTTWGDKIETFLQNGGNLYIEGGNCFYYDPLNENAWDPNPWTGTNALEDGSNDLGPVMGISNNLIPQAGNHMWNYTGENSSIDRIEADSFPPNGGVAENILQDAIQLYYTGVAYDQGTWRTFASSGELGGYSSGSIESESLALWIMDFLKFGPPPHDVGVTSIIEPSEPIPVGGTVTPKVEVMNLGEFIESFDVEMEIYLEGVPVYSDIKAVTDLEPDSTQEVTFSDWTADSAGTYEIVAYTMLSDDSNPGNDTATSSVIVYSFIYDYLVMDLDSTPISGSLINNFLSNQGLTGTLTYSSSYLDSLFFYKSIWICLGMYPHNHSLSETDVGKIQTYLEIGGMAYIEGGDCWGFDASKAILDPLFGIDPDNTSDGDDDLDTVLGISNSLIPDVEGLTWSYSGENSWVDRLSLYTSPPYGGTVEAYLINPTVMYNCGVLYDQGTWKGVAHSFESGGLLDTLYTVDSLYMWIARDFFQIVGIKEGEIVSSKGSFLLHPAIPNPARGTVVFTFSIPRKTHVNLKIYDVTGRLITTVASGVFKPGTHRVRWNGRDLNGRSVAQGIYFYTMESDSYRSTKKLIILR